mmetsp:Transcript_47988/g.127108  ORF Transcript_47988/g.127108 Transcript_47988/m.127108 type:complete len:612 (-) Transcript_47988:137-1972(-)
MGYSSTSMENVDTNDTGTCPADHDVQSSCSVADASTADDTDANDEGVSDDEDDEVQECQPFVRHVVIYKSERYIPVSGWSSSYLLPTDGYVWQSRSRRDKWTQAGDAAVALLGYGWEYLEPEWRKEDSTEESEMKDTRTFRRVRHVRLKHFTGLGLDPNVQSGQCEECDPAEVALVSDKLLHMVSHTMKNMEPVSETRLIKALGKAYEHFGLIGEKKVSEGSQTGLDDAINSFMHLQKSWTDRLVGTTKSTVVAAGRRVKLLEQWITDVELKFFSRALIRRFSPLKACSERAGHAKCPFREVLCEHGCGERMSFSFFETVHHNECGFRLVSCTSSGCKDMVAKRHLDKHLDCSCPMRIVSCPFRSLGCITSVKATEVEPHMDNCTQSHLLLALNVIADQQQTIAALQEQVISLEAKVEAHMRTDWSGIAAQAVANATSISVFQGQISTMKDALTRHDQEHKELEHEVKSQGKDTMATKEKLVKDTATTSAVVSSLRSEVGTLATSVSKVTQESKRLDNDQKRLTRDVQFCKDALAKSDGKVESRVLKAEKEAKRLTEEMGGVVSQLRLNAAEARTATTTRAEACEVRLSEIEAESRRISGALADAAGASRR